MTNGIVVCYVAERYEQLPKPFRSYRSWVFRNESRGPAARQFMKPTPAPSTSPAVMPRVWRRCAEALGIERGIKAARSTAAAMPGGFQRKSTSLRSRGRAGTDRSINFPNGTSVK
jgi:hypothetical protein